MSEAAPEDCGPLAEVPAAIVWSVALGLAVGIPFALLMLATAPSGLAWWQIALVEIAAPISGIAFGLSLAPIAVVERVARRRGFDRRTFALVFALAFVALFASGAEGVYLGHVIKHRSLAAAYAATGDIALAVARQPLDVAIVLAPAALVVALIVLMRLRGFTAFQQWFFLGAPPSMLFALIEKSLDAHTAIKAAFGGVILSAGLLPILFRIADAIEKRVQRRGGVASAS